MGALGDPLTLPSAYPNVHYVFRRLGTFSDELPAGHFDRVFTVSTLEHIPEAARLAVLTDTDRVLALRGVALHSIDVSVRPPRREGSSDPALAIEGPT